MDAQVQEPTQESEAQQIAEDVLNQSEDQNTDEQPQPQSEAEPEIEDRRISESEDRLIEIQNAERAVRIKEAEWNALKDDTKDAKSEYEDAVEHLRQLCSAAENDRNRPLLNGIGDAGDEKPEPPKPEDEWKEKEITEWLDVCSVKGLGEKKIVALKDKFPTLGDFDKAYQDSKEAGIPFLEYMPKGLGEAMTQSLEDSFFEYVIVITGNEETDSEREVRILDLYAQIKSKKIAEDPEDSDTWEQGRDSYLAGQQVTECDFEDEELTDWIRGWISMEDEENENSSSKPNEQSEDQEQNEASTSGTSKLDSL